MQDNPTGDYKGHAIVPKALRSTDGRFYSVFTVHTATRTANHVYFQLVHEEGKIEGVIFDNEADAIDDAGERAKAWVDAHPV